jgi:hypothetical protein
MGWTEQLSGFLGNHKSNSKVMGLDEKTRITFASLRVL